MIDITPEYVISLYKRHGLTPLQCKLNPFAPERVGRRNGVSFGAPAKACCAMGAVAFAVGARERGAAGHDAVDIDALDLALGRGQVGVGRGLRLDFEAGFDEAMDGLEHCPYYATHGVAMGGGYKLGREVGEAVKAAVEREELPKFTEAP